MEAKGKFISPIRKSPAIPTLVADQIIDLISRGKLKPGDRLPSEHEMTERFRISRISLREAMKLLEAKGYVESRHRKGKFVRSPADTARPPSKTSCWWTRRRSGSCYACAGSSTPRRRAWHA